MTAQELKRKLTAILSADVKGYSRLMGEDEEWTVRTLDTFKGVMKNIIPQHRGRVVDSTGDNLLAEFASVVDAVQASVEIQQVLRAKNSLLPENRRMEFRIGINLGDVIEEGERIFGDGVNIAARLESLAEAGGTCISGSAFEQIENKLPLHYDYLGEHEVKIINRPVRVYRALMDNGVTETKGARPAAQGSRKKILALGLAAALLVIAGAALWQFALRPTPPAPPLKAVEKADPQKMAYALPDRPSIAVLPFTNMSDDPKQEFFSDGITEEIITALSKLPQFFVIARNSTFTYKGKAVKIKQVSEELGVQYVLEGSVRRDGDRVRITAQLIDGLSGKHLWAERMEMIAKAISLDPEEGHFYALRGVVHAQMRQYDEALADAAKALSLEPNHPGVLNESASVLWRSGKPEQALPLFDRLFRLSPVPVIGNFTGAGMAYNLAGQYEKAAEMFRKAIQKYPQVYLGHLGYAISAALLGRTEEASGAVKELLRVNPRFSIEQFKEFQARVGVRDQAAVEKFSEALRKAGLPETAPKG